MDAAYTSVQVHTDKRIVPVQRDCDAEPTLFKIAPPPPPQHVQMVEVPRMMQMPRMPRMPRDNGFVPYFQPARPNMSVGPVIPSQQYAPVQPANNYTSYAEPNGFAGANQDYGFMAPGPQPQYSTVQAPAPWARGP